MKPLPDLKYSHAKQISLSAFAHTQTKVPDHAHFAATCLTSQLRLGDLAHHNPEASFSETTCRLPHPYPSHNPPLPLIPLLLTLSRLLPDAAHPPGRPPNRLPLRTRGIPNDRSVDSRDYRISHSQKRRLVDHYCEIVEHQRPSQHIPKQGIN